MIKACTCIVTVLVAVCSVSNASASSKTAQPERIAATTAREPGESVLRRGDAYYRLMNAFLHARKGNVSDAVKDLREALRLQPDSADIRAEVAGMLVDMGQAAEGERQARKTLELDPDNGKALRLLASLSLQRARHGRPSNEGMFEGISLYERVVRLPDAEPEEFHDLARMKMSVGDVAGAVETMQEFLDDHPGDATGVRILVTGLVHLERRAEAVEILLSHLERSRKLPVRGVDLGEAVSVIETYLRDTDSWQEFAERAPAILAAQSESGVLHALYGEALFNLGRYTEAVASMEKALSLGHEQPVLRYQLASSYAGQGRLADSLELVQVLAGQFPDHAGVHGLLGEVRARMGATDGAVEALNDAMEALGTGEAEAGARDRLRMRIASIYLASERTGEALLALDALEGEENAESQELRARSTLITGDLRQARQAARKIRGLGQPGIAWVLEAEAYVRESKLDKARARFEEAAAVMGAGIAVRAAEVFRENGNPEIGREILQHWVEREPSNADARFSLGAYLERNRQFEEAEAELLEAIRLRPRFAEALNYLGYSLADRDLRNEDALEFVKRALEVDPWNGAFLDSLGWVYYRLGRFEEALEPLQRAAREYPRDATVQEHLGDLLEKLGQRDKALEAWRRALESGPDDPERLRTKIGGLPDGER